ncbi:HAD-IA family hydrolase, partial [Candidatus Bathyarchaeota archaeon]|nr:HAD-IA family hydrolase [Candidatus Bathyarchaeota archaeon]
GWRKPSPEIFKEALRRLDMKAEETFFVGDTPLEDIQGAKKVGMKTVFIPSQFNTLIDMEKVETPPDHYIENLRDLSEILST